MLRLLKSIVAGTEFEVDDISKEIVPMSVRRYEPVVSNDTSLTVVPTISVFRQALLLTSQSLRFFSPDADTMRWPSCDL
jgi:hypothetical protein